MIKAHYFDCEDSNPHFVSLLFNATEIELQTEDRRRKRYTKNDFKLMEPFENAPLIMHFADGSYCEIYEVAEKNKLQEELGYRPSSIERCQRKWPYAIFAILLIVFGAYFSYQFGSPYLAKKIVPLIPLNVDSYLGDEVSDILERRYFKTSKIDNVQFTQAVMVMRKIQPESWKMPLRLDIPISDRIGANAMALPNGRIYVTDAMFSLMLNKDGQLTEDGKNELAAVLAHEIGHVELRHAMHGLVQTSLLTVLVGSTIGDFSNVIALGSSAMLNANYSRDIETEADEYAIALMRKRDISPIHLANLFNKLETHYAVKKTNAKKSTLGVKETIRDYLASHPSTEKRIARFREAAADFEKTSH